jgi:hypothetical protein
MKRHRTGSHFVCKQKQNETVSYVTYLGLNLSDPDTHKFFQNFAQKILICRFNMITTPVEN